MTNSNTTAFVLAGGGFKGAFEVGVMRALIVDHQIVPQVMTATSAGAVLGTVVGQGRTVEECSRYVGVARSDLMAMTNMDVVFAEQPWLQQLAGTDAADAIHRLVTQHGRPELDDDWDELAAEATTVMEEGGDPPPSSGAPGGSSGAPRGRRRRRHRLEEIAQVARTIGGRGDHGLPRAALSLDPFEQSVRGHKDVGIAPVDMSLVARPGLELRLAVTALHAKETHYITQEGVLVGSDATTPIPGVTTDVIEGMLASASVPGVFPPRDIGGEHYVDGGCLQNIPLQAAVDLGADRIFTLICVPVRTPKRTLSLWAAESLGYLSTQEANLRVTLPEGTSNTIIEPTIEVVGSFEVHVGLMRIDIDYGHMRAMEVLTGLDDGMDPIVKMASDTVTQMRRVAWQYENRCIQAGTIDAEHLAGLRRIKNSVRVALQARTALGFAAPPEADSWWQTWELHNEAIPDDFPRDLT